MQKLYTPAGEALQGTPWESYPRPQLKRADWLCLNGTWELTVNGTVRQILVPFCPESLLSGVDEVFTPGTVLRYRRSFTLPEGWAGKRVLLQLGAVSRIAAVYVNGSTVAAHDNGYLPFSADITDALQPGENELVITAVNDLSNRHPIGKQKLKRGGMWYTPVSGIWQTVWLEPVPETYITGIDIDAGLDAVTIRAEGVTEGTVTLEGQRYPLTDGSVTIRPENPRLWSPEDPQLYSFTIESGEDKAESYFALRSLEKHTVNGIPRLCLNGKPYFFNGLLDQGYWSDGLYTPAGSAAFAEDILRMKALGFNMLRKHIKVEPEQFYYDCDRLGMVVFQDMVNCGEYHFLRDTVLPTLHFLRLSDRRLNPDPEARANFLAAMDETVTLLKNHPCICLWTIFNEGWGQFCADEAYDRLRALDSSRFIDSSSGWFHQKKSDVDSLHLYFERLHPGKEPALPQYLSEFGGWSYKIAAHSYNLQQTYGYRKYGDGERFAKELRALYEEQVLPYAKKGLCAAVYTQVSDVEDETNGLLTYDRRVQKIPPETLAGLAPLLQQAVLGTDAEA